jgi:hypothetical protein
MDICFFFKAIGEFLMHITGNKPPPAPAPTQQPQPQPQIIILPPPAPVPVKVKSNSTEDYINSSWSDSDTAKLSLERVEIELRDPTDESYRMCTNTCKRILDKYSMKVERKQQIANIRDKIMKYDSDMAREIDLGQFSTATSWEGKFNWR